MSCSGRWCGGSGSTSLSTGTGGAGGAGGGAGGEGARDLGGRPRRFFTGRSSEGLALGGRPRFTAPEGAEGTTRGDVWGRNILIKTFIYEALSEHILCYQMPMHVQSDINSPVPTSLSVRANQRQNGVNVYGYTQLKQ